MTRPIVHQLNVETQELTVREMTDEEYAQHLIDQEQISNEADQL